MEATSKISSAGKETEELFCNITGAIKSTKPSLGDVLLDEVYIEIKKTSTGSVNQVRAVKYLPLVVYSSKQKCWYVVPADVVVQVVSTKSRGQHTENPFECASISLKSVERFKVENQEDLALAAKAAHERATQAVKVKGLMSQMLHTIRKVAETTKCQLQEALSA